MKEPKSQISYLRLSDALQITGFIEEDDLLLIKNENCEVFLGRFKDYNKEDNYVEFIREHSGMIHIFQDEEEVGLTNIFVAKIECFEVLK